MRVLEMTLALLAAATVPAFVFKQDSQGDRVILRRVEIDADALNLTTGEAAYIPHAGSASAPDTVVTSSATPIYHLEGGRIRKLPQKKATAAELQGLRKKYRNASPADRRAILERMLEIMGDMR